MGRAWFGYEGGTIILLKDENIQRVFPADDSPVGSVRAINGRGRHIWVGGELGLAFFDGNRFRRIVPADAETFGSVMGVEETSDGSLWLAESGVVIRDPSIGSPASPGRSLLSREVSYLRLFRRPSRHIRGCCNQLKGDSGNRRQTLVRCVRRNRLGRSCQHLHKCPSSAGLDSVLESKWQTSWFADESGPAPANNRSANWLHGFEPGCAGEGTFSVQAGRSG